MGAAERATNRAERNGLRLVSSTASDDEDIRSANVVARSHPPQQPPLQSSSQCSISSISGVPCRLGLIIVGQ